MLYKKDGAARRTFLTGVKMQFWYLVRYSASKGPTTESFPVPLRYLGLRIIRTTVH